MVSSSLWMSKKVPSTTIKEKIVVSCVAMISVRSERQHEGVADHTAGAGRTMLWADTLEAKDLKLSHKMRETK